MENAAGKSDSCSTRQWGRYGRQPKADASCETARYVASRASYQKSVCEAASTALSTPQRLPSPHNAAICAPPTPYADFSAPSEAPPVTVILPAPTNSSTVGLSFTPSAEASLAYPTSSRPPHTTCELVDALRQQVEQSVRRARDAEENERQLRLALLEVEENQGAVLRALHEYRDLKVPEGGQMLQERIHQLEAENALLRAEIHNKDAQISTKDIETEKLSQQLFDISCTLETVQREHSSLLGCAREAKLSAAGTRMRFFATPGGDKIEVVGASCQYAQAGNEGDRLAETAHVLSDKNSRSRGTRCNRAGMCSQGTPMCNDLSDEEICAVKPPRAASPPSPKPAKDTAELQEENTVLKKALRKASAAVDGSAALLREKERDVEMLRKHEGYVEQLQLKEKESKQLLQQLNHEIEQLKESLLQQELSKASAEQVSAKLNARVTALQLQVRQTESRCEETVGVYNSKIKSLEERLATYSPPVCLEAQTQTTHLSCSPSPLREFLELNTESFSSLTFDMKKRLVASEQDKNDKLLEHDRLVEEKELRLSELSARFAAATEEHAAERKKMHAKIVELEGELSLSGTKYQTMTRVLQKARGRLRDGLITQQVLATEKQEEADAHQRVVSSLELRLQAEKEKLKEALCSMDAVQKHLRRLTHHTRVSTTSTQASQTEDRHSVILEVPAEFQEQLDLLSAPHSPDTRHSPTSRNGRHQQRKNKFHNEDGCKFTLQSADLQCKKRICTQFAMEASERICMLTATLLCKTHALAAAEERLTALQQGSKTNYSLTRQLSEERRGRLEACRCLSRAETEWREKVYLLEKQNESLLQEKNEAVERADLLHASEAKLQRESLLLREEHGLCRKQLEELHQEHTARASQERNEHERLLETLKHYFKAHLARNSRLHPSILSSEADIHVSCDLAQTVGKSAAKRSKILQSVSTEGRIPVSLDPPASEASACATRPDLVRAIQHLTTATVSLIARLEKAESVTVSAKSPTTRCCSSPPTSACGCMTWTCSRRGCSASTGSEWEHSGEKCGADHGRTCRSRRLRLCSSAPHTCGVHSHGLARTEEALGEHRPAGPADPSTQHRRASAKRYTEQTLQEATSRTGNWRFMDTLGKVTLQSPTHTCNRGAAYVEEGVEAQKRGEGYVKCRKRGILLPGVNRETHQSVISAEAKELLDQICDLFLCAGQRLADTEQRAAINEVVAALTYKQWQLQKGREAELLRDRALLRHQLQAFQHQHAVSQAVGDRLDSGLCKLYRRRCEEIEKQQLVAIRQLRVHEEEHKHLTNKLRDTEQHAQALQQRLAWIEAKKAETELLMESTDENSIMQRLLTFKEEVLESLQAELNQLSLVSSSPVCNGEREAEEAISCGKLSRLTQQVTQERCERAALFFALKEMQQENKMILHLLDQKDKQLALLQDIKLPRPANVATMVENAQGGAEPQADSIVQKKISSRPTEDEAATSTATTSASLCVHDVETFPLCEKDVDSSQAELLGTLSHLKGVVHQQQMDMHKQAEKLSCCKIEAANLRLRNESLSSELSTHLSKLNESQAAVEDTARVRARMEEVETWASRLRQAHQAELKSMRSAQKCRLKQMGVEWEEKTNKELNALHAENLHLKTVTRQLCADTEALRQQLWRHKEAMQRHNVLEELSQAGFGALHAFQLESSPRKTRCTAQQTTVAGKGAAFRQSLMQHRERHNMSSGLPTGVSRSAFRLGAHISNKPGQRLKSAVPLKVVKCLLQAFVQLCIQLAECERQLLTVFDPSTSASLKDPSSNKPQSTSPQPVQLCVPQYPSRETSVLRGQRIVIRWLYCCSVNRLKDSSCPSALDNSNATGVLYLADASTAGETAGGRSMTEKAVDTMMSALLGADQSFVVRRTARDLPPHQRRAVHHLQESARELLSVLKQTCQSVTTARCAQQLIVDRLTGIERALRFMRRVAGIKHKTEQENYLRKIHSDVASTDLLHLTDSGKDKRDSMCSRKRHDSECHKRSDSSTTDSKDSELASQKHCPCCSKKVRRALAKKRVAPETKFVLSRRALTNSLSETEQLLQLICSCAEECSAILERADLAAEGLSAKLGVIFFRQNMYGDGVRGQADDRGGTFVQDKGIFSSKTRRIPLRSWPWLYQSCSSNRGDARKNCSHTRGRSLTLCKSQWKCSATDEKFKNSCRHASRPTASGIPTHSRSSSAVDFSGTKRSPVSISFNQDPASSWSERAHLPWTSNGSRTSSRSSPMYNRSNSFLRRRQGRTATSTRRRMCRSRSFIRETSWGSGQTDIPLHSDTTSVVEASRRDCTYGSSTVSVTTAALPSATTVSPARRSPVNNKLKRSSSSGPGTPALFPENGSPRDNRNTPIKAYRTEQQVKRDKSIRYTQAGGERSEGQGFIHGGFSPLSSPPMGPSSTKVSETQQSTKEHLSQGSSPRLPMRHRLARDTLMPTSVNHFDSNLEWSADYFPARLLQSGFRTETGVNTSSNIVDACKSSCAVTHETCTSTGDNGCSYPPPGSPQNKKISGLRDPAWSRQNKGTKVVGEDTILSPASGSEVSNVSLQPSPCLFINSDTASVGAVDRIKYVTEGHLSKPPHPCSGNTGPLSPTERRVVTFSSHQRQRYARQGRRSQQPPNLVTSQKSVSAGLVGEQVKRSRQQGKPHPSKMSIIPSQPVNKLSGIRRYDNAANSYGAQQMIQQKKPSCTKPAQATALCLGRPDWLPPLSNSQGSLQNDSALHGSRKGRSPFVRKVHSPSAAMNNSGVQTEDRHRS